MTPSLLKAWVLAALLHFAPPINHQSRPWADTSIEAALVRYGLIADSIVAAVGDKSGARDRAALLAALALGESGLAADADQGPCVRTGAYKTRCDSGHAASVWQLHAFGGHTLAELFGDRKLAARIVLNLAVGSFRQCEKLAPEDRLSGMGLGHCEAGNKSVRERFALYRKLQNWSPAK